MGYAAYHRADVAGCSGTEAVARARRIVETCAMGEVRVEVELATVDRAALARLGHRLARPGPSDFRPHPAPTAISPRSTGDRVGSGEARRVDILVIPSNLPEAVERARPWARVSVQGRVDGLYSDLVFEGPVAVLAIHAPLATARDAVARQLALAARVGLADPGMLDAALAAPRDQLVEGLTFRGHTIRCRSFDRDGPRALEIAGPVPAGASWLGLWTEAPFALHLDLDGPDAVGRAAELAGDDEILEARLSLYGEAAVDALADLDWPEPACVAWWCAFDGYGRAYHGVRLALNGRYQDGRIPERAPGHDLVVLVDGKRPDGDEVVARISAASGIALTRDGSGL